MRTYSRRFTNERGETVIVHASEKDAQGVSGILLSVAGPDSETELHITKQEAVEVLEALNKLMKPRTPRA